LWFEGRGSRICGMGGARGKPFVEENVSLSVTFIKM
jgi:hypothetical protein